MSHSGIKPARCARKRPRLARHKEQAKRIRRGKALARQQLPVDKEAYELKPTYNRYGMRAHRTFGIVGVPSPGHPGLWPILRGGGFFDREAGQRIVLGDWKTSSMYSTVTVVPNYGEWRRHKLRISRAMKRLRARGRA